jgi:hypothetical protein
MLKAGLAALVVAGLGTATAALATPNSHSVGHDSTVTTSTTNGTTTSHKPSTTGAGCRPEVSLIVKGTTTADATDTSLTLTVTGGNHFAKPLFANDAKTLLTVNTQSTTKVADSSGQATTLSSIKSSSKVLVMYRVCKADLKSTSNNTPTLLASTLSSNVGAKTMRVVLLGSSNDD